MVWSKGSGWFGFRSAVPGIALLFMITFVGLGNASAATTHYISKSAGSDSNNGTSKSTPWAHFPGMIGATSNAAFYTPQPGDQFILKGGDTWVAADLGINTCPSSCWNGTVGSPIYIGVDQTWFTGSSWARPKFDCQGTTCTLAGGAVVWLYSDNWIFDNIEITGVTQGSSGLNYIGIVGANVVVENSYFHGWTSASNPPTAYSAVISTNWSAGSGGVGSQIHDNVIDGSDNPFYAAGGTNDFMGGIMAGYQVYNNVVRDVYNGMNGSFNDIHGNLVENNDQAWGGVNADHCNMIFPQNVLSGTTIYIYNNVIRNKGCGTTLFTLANANNTSLVAYQFNNVLYNNASGNDGIGSGGHYPTGAYYDYNNTVQSLDNCFGNGEAPSTKSTTYFGNNHCIAPTVCIGTGTTCTDQGGNLQQTAAQANADASTHFDQYTSLETYAYSPVASTNSTVQAGNNLSSLCSGNLAALCNDAAYPEYDSVNHVVVMRTVVPRPPSGAWDIGAYLYNPGGAPPNPPTSLTATVN